VARLVVAVRPLHEALIEPPFRPGGTSVGCGMGFRRFFARSASRRAIPRVIFENIFLQPSGPRLTSSTRAAQFDKLTKRGNALDMSWSVRDRSY
jgi:hypothetical protein